MLSILKAKRKLNWNAERKKLKKFKYKEASIS
jgi:hypothetical protein